MRLRLALVCTATAALTGAWLDACSSTDLAGGSAGSKATTKNGKAGNNAGTPGDDGAPSDTSTDTGTGGDPGTGTEASAGETKVDSTNGTAGQVFAETDGSRRELFDFGGDSTTPIADYLFVVDNSPSMTDKVAKLQAGIKSLAAGVFPEKALIGVINTMPAKVGDYATSFNGGGQEAINIADAEPGFMGLVTKDRIAAYKALGGNGSSHFNMPGCADGWFAPDSKDDAGNRCFDAATQISLHGGPCEAGIEAVAQFVAKEGTTRVFRKGAAVNVVFISDTQDPGCGAAAGNTLNGIRPTFDAFKTSVTTNSPGVTAVTAHGIFPTEPCKESEGAFPAGQTYAAWATASKGQVLDLCNATDFSGVVEKIAKTTQVQTPVFTLSEKAKGIISVSIDGVKTDKYTLADGDVLTLDASVVDATKVSKIDVLYSPE